MAHPIFHPTYTKEDYATRILGYPAKDFAFWLGFNRLKELTAFYEDKGSSILRFESVSAFVDYESFEVGSPDDNFPFRVGEANTPFLARFGLTSMNETRFLTPDASDGCSEVVRAGFYDRHCHLVLDIFGPLDTELLWPTGLQETEYVAMSVRPKNHNELQRVTASHANNLMAQDVIG